jgi:RNA polymerase sigma factor (sigma-70 family)
MLTISWIAPELPPLVIGSSRAPDVRYARALPAESRPPHEPALPELTQDLVLSALGGDGVAIRQMVGALTPVIHARVGRTLLRRRAHLAGGGRERLDDLVQDVFVELFRDGGRALRAWDPARGLSLANWVGLIAEQRASAALRGRKRDLAADLPLDDAPEEQASPEYDPEATVFARDKLERLLDLLRAELSPLGLQLFHALIAEQEPIPSVSARLGMSTSAVQAWSSRLKRRIAELMAELSVDLDPAEMGTPS